MPSLLLLLPRHCCSLIVAAFHCRPLPFTVVPWLLAALAAAADMEDDEEDDDDALGEEEQAVRAVHLHCVARCSVPAAASLALIPFVLGCPSRFGFLHILPFLMPQALDEEEEMEELEAAAEVDAAAVRSCCCHYCCCCRCNCPLLLASVLACGTQAALPASMCVLYTSVTPVLPLFPFAAWGGRRGG
jgi:hypothetical protein